MARYASSVATKDFLESYRNKQSEQNFDSRRAEGKTHLPVNRLDPAAAQSHETEVRTRDQRRMTWLVVGFVSMILGSVLVARQIEKEVGRKTKMDSGPLSPEDPMNNAGRERKVLVEKRLGEGTGEADQMPTGTTTVPFFPKAVQFADVDGKVSKQEGVQEYQLVGCGVRTVSFLRVEVYVAGIYIATDDIAALQQRLIRKIDPIATTLVPSEKDKLKQHLLDGDKSEEIWNEILKDGGLRTLVRIVPTRNTDFQHMRDAWVRHLKARTQKNPNEYGDESFGLSVQQLRQMLTGGSVPKGREMLLCKGRQGELSIWYDDGKGSRRIGCIEDERVSRAIFLNYLGGKEVASEKARKSVVEGVMEFVERPVGTVATQVHM